MPISRRPVFVAIKPYSVRLSRPQPRSKLPQVDLRPTIQSLGLAVRSQGSRGTCSVFAMTLLLEYAYGTRLNTGSNDLSEEYLNYAANVATNNTGDGDYFDSLDRGYQAWGIVPEASEPYQPAAGNFHPSGLYWTRVASGPALLEFHDLTTQTPHEMWMAIDVKAHRPSVSWPPLKIVRFSGQTLTNGVEKHMREGVEVQVYSAAKTVADCFKYRNKIGIDIAIEPHRDILRQKKANIETPPIRQDVPSWAGHAALP